MPRLNSKIINNEKNMKKEFAMPLITGIIVGALIMIFWQFSVRLNNINSALVQLEQASAQNTKTISDVVGFINNATGANKGAAATTGAGAATTPAQ
jgi:amino acid permease